MILQILSSLGILVMFLILLSAIKAWEWQGYGEYKEFRSGFTKSFVVACVLMVPLGALLALG